MSEPNIVSLLGCLADGILPNTYHLAHNLLQLKISWLDDSNLFFFFLKMSVTLDQCQNSSKPTFVRKGSLAQPCLAHNVTCLRLALDTAKSGKFT